MAFKPVRFQSQPTQAEFFNTLRSRVNEYFESRKIGKHANGAMIFKMFAMLAMYLGPIALIVTNVSSSYWVNFGLWVLTGIGMAGVGLSVMHDANHGAFSENQKVNNFIGGVMFILGGHPANWKIQHNVLHHSFTNIDGLDEDIAPVALLRFSPNKERKGLHKFQHIYAWFLYTLMTVLWSTTKDFRQIIRYTKMGLIKTQKKSAKRLWFEIISSKLLYYVLFLAVPVWLSAMPWYLTISGYLFMHLLCGFILACVFQPAHVMPDMQFVDSNVHNSVSNSWAAHELLTTTNFAPTNKLLSWYVGGLNFQIEHHLFPNICHIHYSKIAPIVEATAKEYNLPYHSFPTFRSALKAHTEMLRKLGTEDQVKQEFKAAS